MDIFYLAVVCGFFLIAIAYVFGCERLLGGDND